MFLTVRYSFWTKATSLVGLLLVGLLLHHVFEEHHEEHRADCPICLFTTSLFVVASFASIAMFLVYLGILHQCTTVRSSTTVTGSQGRSPPLPVIL